ncbi:DUF433 domain-containing protein [Noviherbaspirillum denitrificans]|uniref:DUF433 domain-containing protein n=1 Tax=Noviherbaspirillum denitrificans TaxID=1968433 RepID=UPI00113123F6
MGTELNEHRYDLIHFDRDVMCGIAVFVGTRIPVENITASLACGMREAEVLAAYPQLTQAHLTAAVAFAASLPERQPARRLGETNPTWVLTTSGVVRPATP